jgi:hypothetical protein
VKGEMRIIKHGSPSWNICISSDESLNFAIYTGCSFGFISKESYVGQVPLWPYKCLHVESGDEVKFTILADQWSKWWQQLVRRRAMNILQGISNPTSELFDPPEFSRLDIAGLEKYCNKVWPYFHQWWNMPAGGKAAMAHWQSFGNINGFITKFEESRGRKIKPFKLYIDLVYTGIPEKIELSMDYVIMPLRPKPLMDEEWWMRKLENIG